jgi:hypothetical protein
MKRPLAVVVAVIIALGLVGLLGLPPVPFLEEVAFARKADPAIYRLDQPAVPSGFTGDVFQFSDGWIVIIYGQSSLAGHGIWNYNLAKSSRGDVYVSDRHFCTSISHQAEVYARGKTLQSDRIDTRLDAYLALINAKHLEQALAELTKISFTKQ